MDEQFGNLCLSKPRSNLKRRLVKRVPRVGFCVPIDQLRTSEPASNSTAQCSGAIVIAYGRFGTGLEQDAHDRDFAAGGCKKDRRLAAVVVRTRVRPSRDQRLRKACIPVTRRHEQRCRPVPVARVGIFARSDEPSYAIGALRVPIHEPSAHYPNLLSPPSGSRTYHGCLATAQQSSPALALECARRTLGAEDLEEGIRPAAVVP